MQKAVFSYEGKEVWKFQNVLFVRNPNNCIIYTNNQERVFESLHEALDFIQEVTGRYAVFKIGEE